MATDLPTFTQKLPDGVADLVGEFAALAPGISWSREVLDGILACVDHGGIDIPAIVTPTERTTGLINAHKTKGVAKQHGDKAQDDPHGTRKYVLVTVCIRARLPAGDHGPPDFVDSKFSFDRPGIKQAIEWLQQQVNRLRRQGLCRECLGYREPPLKRLCVGRTGMCAVCVVAKAVCE